MDRLRTGATAAALVLVTIACGGCSLLPILLEDDCCDCGYEDDVIVYVPVPAACPAPPPADPPRWEPARPTGAGGGGATKTRERPADTSRGPRRVDDRGRR